MGIERPSVAKITRPVLPGTYPRTRLYRLLDKSRKVPITWVSGPPGCGKTTSVSGYVGARRLRGIWYQVDEGDGDPATFFYYLGLAGSKAAPRKRSPLPLLTPEFLPSLNAFTHRFFEDLLGRLGAGSVLVFDNCQNAPSRSPFFGLLREGLSRLPAGITVILISRNDPPPEFARNRVNRQLGMVGWRELRLTAEETRGIARLRRKRGISGDVTREAHRRADGWAAGVTLLLDTEGWGGTESRTMARRPPGEIFDYFAEEVYSRLGKEMKEFLLRSAFLPRMTAGMAERLTGNPRADRILSYLSRHNYFTETHPAPEPVYQYHALFREFLLLHAQSAFPGTEGQGIRREAAAILLEGGQAEDAVEHLRAIGDWSGLARVILREAPSLVGQGRTQVLSGWVRFLPEEHFRATPWLSYWLGVAILPFEPANARRLFEEALARFRQDGDAAGAFLSWSAIVPAVWFEGAGFGYYDSFLPTLEDLLREFGRFPSPEIEARTLCGMMQALANCLPTTVDGDAWIARARAVAEEISDASLKGALLMKVLSYLIARGFHSGEVNSAYAPLEPLLRAKALTPIDRIELSLYAAHNFLSMAEYDRSLEVAAEGLKLAESSGLHILDMLLLGKATIAVQHKGDVLAARNIFRRMASLLPKAIPHEAAFYYNLAAYDALEKGDVARAEQHWNASTELGLKTGLPAIHHFDLILGALVKRALGNTLEAHALLAEARKIESRFRCDSLPYYSTLMESILLVEDGDVSGGVGKLREAMRRGRELGLLGMNFWFPSVQANVAARALREGIEIPYVQEMIRKNRLLPGPGDLDLEEWPWPVRIYTLGRFDLVVDEAPPPSGRKAPQKPLQLLKALIALGGREVPEEHLGEILWPDADGDLAHESLSTNLKRLRKRLGDDRSVLLRDGRVTLNNRHCWVDAWAFERVLGQAGAARKPGVPVPDGREIARIAEQAIGLYRGTFLAGETFCPDIVTYRERLRSKFLRTVAQAGRHWEQTGDWEMAVACYQKGLEVDPLSEGLCRSLLACHVRMGRVAEAHAAYQRFRKTLSGVLGVSPSPDLEAILKSVSAVPGPGGR
jgi:LuxR family maltose regulon positive regulatory protein